MDERLALLLHPVRLRVAHAMRIDGPLTTSELCARLPDVARATVYRHVDRLVRGGVLNVESERKVRGGVERVLRLDLDAAAVGVEQASSMSIEDHRRGFAAAMGALIADFGSYLDRDEADPRADEVSYRQFVIWLNEDERTELVRELGRTVRTLAGKAPVGRRPHVLSTVLFPAPR